MVQDIRRVLVVEKNWHFKESNDHDWTEFSRSITSGRKISNNNLLPRKLICPMVGGLTYMGIDLFLCPLVGHVEHCYDGPK